MKLNPYKCTEIRRCEWCGHFFHPAQHNQKYCSKECSKYAKLERNRIWIAKRRENKELREKLIGTSNIREHRNQDFSKELEIVRKEKKRFLKKY